MANEKTPLIPGSNNNIVPPSDASGNTPTVYFLERQNSLPAQSSTAPNSVDQADPREIETLPEGSTAEEFNPRPVTSAGRTTGGAGGPLKSHGGWIKFFSNVGKKSDAFAGTSSGGEPSVVLPRSAPVKVDPKVFFANERTFLAWIHVSVILAGASVAIVAFADAHTAYNQLYGVILLPVSIAFILYSMMQYSRRASMIRRKAPGPYVDIVGPTVLTVILMLSIVAQFSIKLYTLM